MPWVIYILSILLFMKEYFYRCSLVSLSVHRSYVVRILKCPLLSTWLIEKNLWNWQVAVLMDVSISGRPEVFFFFLTLLDNEKVE